MSLPSDEEQDLDDTLPGPSFSNSLDIDTEITDLLQSLRLEETRRGPVTQADDEFLKRIHERIHGLIRMVSEPDRRRRFKKAHGSANRIREELYNLRRALPQNLPHHSYFERIQPVVQDVVTCSFDQEYRKVAIVLGLADSLAELIISEVTVYGTTPRFPEHKSIRKLIANALTNLTYQDGASKKRLCSYPDFIHTVVLLFREAKNLVQVYAGLIRNLSWMADSEMTVALNPCVPALASAAVEAQKASDEYCVRAILSALWNLASHSTENKKAICDQPGCLLMLTSILTSGTNQIVDIESASGILKYVSQYLANHSDHIELRPQLVKALVIHLDSPSFTALSNALGALGNLISKDPHVQNAIRCDNNAMRHLASLRDSKQENISGLVKTVLQHLNQNPGFRRPNHPMSASIGVPYGTPRDRLLNRANIASPGNPSPMAMPQFASPFLDPQRSSSLPRHFARGGFTASLHSQVHQTSQYRPYPPSIFPQPQEPTYPPLDAQDEDNLEDDNESLDGNKTNASRRSLESELPSGWNSLPESRNTTSTKLSPVSPSELPDSPTYYTKQKEIEFSQMLNLGGFNSNGSDLSKNGGSDAATAIVGDYPTPTFPQHTGSSLERQSICTAENDYATLDPTLSSNLLQMSIEAALPPATPRTSKRQKSPMDGAQLLAETIQSAMPQRRSGGRIPDSERLLQDCIQSAMPTPSSTSTLPKNVKGGRIQPVTTTDRLSSGHLFAERLVTSSILFSTNEGSIRDANNLLGELESSDDDFDHELDDEVDSSFPLDCLEDEEVTIDCSILKERKSRPSAPKPSRLPKPTFRTGVSPRVKPPVKPKPQTQAVISPYNYTKPKETKTSPETKPVVHSGANTMLVTTV